MALEDEVIALRLELKGQRETIAGLKSVDSAQKGLGDSTRKAGTEASKAEKKTTRLSSAYRALGTAAKWGLGFLGVGGVFALKQAVDASEDLAAATSGLTRNFGFQTNVASRWAAVMHGRGVEPKALTMAFGTLSSKMVEAGRKGGTALTPFHQLGMTQEEVARGARDFEWGLLRVAKALGDEEGGAKRSTAAKALLGKGFQTLTPLFSEGVEGLQEQLHWADKYGVTLSTTTKDGLMDMVVAGRETKVALLGIQLAMAKAAMPAIEAGQEELHKFIQTLNDPDLSADQKVTRIEAQFERLEDDLINILTDAVPVVAEHAGVLGVKIAGALWQGILSADGGGRLVIAAWIFAKFGGEAAIKAGAFRVGGMVGTRMGVGLATGVVGAYIGFEIYEQLSERTKIAIRQWGFNAGENFVNALVSVINHGIEGINDVLDEVNALSIVGVDAPNIGLIGELDGDPALRRQHEEGKLEMEEGKINGPGGTVLPGQHFPKGNTRGKAPKGGGRRGRRNLSTLPSFDNPDLETVSLGAFGGSSEGGRSRQPIVLHNHFHVDSEKVAEKVARRIIDAESLG